MARAVYRYEDNSKSYTLTDDDVLWLAKALAGEGGYGKHLGRAEASALAWTMFLRFFRWGNKWRSFKSLIRKFSQPTNPAWLNPNGAKCKANPDHCTPARIARRKEIQGWTWDQIPMSARMYATMFAEGGLKQELGQQFVNFATNKTARESGYFFKTHYFLTDKQDSGIRWTNKKVVVDIDPSLKDVDLDGDLTPVDLLLGLSLGYVLYKVGEWVYSNMIKPKKK